MASQSYLEVIDPDCGSAMEQRESSNAKVYSSDKVT